jgi:hypothetical protein
MREEVLNVNSVNRSLTVERSRGCLVFATSERGKIGQDDRNHYLCCGRLFPSTLVRALSERHMSEQAAKPESSTVRYAAVLRISEVLSECREPQQLATVLSGELGHFLPFDHLHIAVFKEGSNEIEWHAWGKGPLPESELPIEELPGWRVFNSQEPLHIADWNQTDSFPRLKQLLAAKGADNQNLGSAIRVPWANDQIMSINS